MLGVASALYGLVASGIGLFNESILAARGFAPGVYHQALAVTALTGLAGNFAAGASVVRIPQDLPTEGGSHEEAVTLVAFRDDITSAVSDYERGKPSQSGQTKFPQTS